MSTTDYPTSERYTKFSESAKQKIEGFFDNLHSREEVYDLIDEFISLPADGSGDVERLIAEILSVSDKSGYYEKHGFGTICMDRTDEKAVLAAADEYRKFAGYLPDVAELDDMFYAKVLEVYNDYKSSSDYIARLVKSRMKTLSPELIKEGDGTRLLIFKQFLKAAKFPKTACLSRELRDYICDITKLPENPSETRVEAAIASLSDSVFEKLDEISASLEGMKKYKTMSRDKYRDAQKSYNKKWEPLMWADDISKSRFSDQRTTRLKLYWFAIIFEMTYYSGAYNEMPDKDTDIQMNLFYGFYADNLLNNLMSTDTDTTLEKEPTGYGINIKNFVEVIYLYYIHRNDMSSLEKLCNANRMIDKCKESNYKVIESQIEKYGKNDTWFYESMISRVMKLSEEELEKFISEKYICGRKGVNAIRAASGNITSADIYSGMVNLLIEIVESVVDHASISYNNIYSVIEYNYYMKKCSRCVNAQDDKLYRECPLFEEKCKNAYADYRMNKMTPASEQAAEKDARNTIIKNEVLSFLRGASDLFGYISESEKNKSFNALIKRIADKFYISDSRKTFAECIQATFISGQDIESYVTRTKMIILYYYIFITQSINMGLEFRSFDDFYNEFCDKFQLVLGNKDDRWTYYGINKCLEESGYQEINTKNIFDMLVVFFAFKHYNKIRHVGIEKGDEKNQ